MKSQVSLMVTRNNLEVPEPKSQAGTVRQFKQTQVSPDDIETKLDLNFDSHPYFHKRRDFHISFFHDLVLTNHFWVQLHPPLQPNSSFVLIKKKKNK